MSTEQKQFLATDEVIQKIAAEMLDGRSFDRLTPRGWRADIVEALPAALAILATRQESVTSASDEEIGRALFEAIAETGTRIMPVTPFVARSLGAYLRSKASLLAGKVEGLLHWPEVPQEMVARHEDVLFRLRVWANDTTDDLQEGVDAQSAYLRAHPEIPWMTDACQSEAWAKDFLGRVMDYKRARLAPLVPVVGMRLKVDGPLNREAYFVPGSIIEVMRVNGSRYEARGTCDSSRNGSVQTDQHQTMFTDELRGYHVMPDDTPVGVPSSDSEPTIEPEDPKVAALHEEIERLTAENRRLSQQAQQRLDDHRHDNEHIADVLNNEASEREWCDEFESVVTRKLNPHLKIPLQMREEDNEIVVSGYLRVPFSVTLTVEATRGTDWDDLCEQAGEALEGNYDASDLLRNYTSPGDAEIADDSYEYERA